MATNDSPSSARLIGVRAWYGPDPTLATKLVVSVFDPSIGAPSGTMRKWLSGGGDIRHDAAVLAEADEFLNEHQIVDAVGGDRIIGCTHEEGIDYPMGRSCPSCPAWAGIDRFTHEPIVADPPTMSPAEILAVLSADDDEWLEEALASADAHREALAEPLVAAIDRGVANPETESEDDASLFAYALYLCAAWREPRALPHVVRWLSLPDEQPFAIGGDIVTQDGARILAAVFGGDSAPIDGLILNRNADEWGRCAGVNALALLAAWGELPREPVVEKLRWLAHEGLEREYSAVWNSLATAIVDLEAVEVFPEIRRAFDDDLIDPQFIDPGELAESAAPADGRLLEELRSRQPPIDDVLEATSWWKDGEEADDEEDDEVAEPQQPYRAPPKVGRNEPCPCGSGKKYKKCCGR